MFDVFGFWGMVSLMVVPAPLLVIHGYMQRLHGILTKEGVKPSEKSILTRNLRLPPAYYSVLLIAAILQVGLSSFVAVHSFRTGDAFLHSLAGVAEKMAPVGGFFFAAIALCAVIYFGERLMIKVARVTVALDKLSDK